MLFKIYYDEWDWELDFLFEGPDKTPGEWAALCESLVPQAIERALEIEEGWIGYPNIIDRLAEVLEQNGYRSINPIGWGLSGPSIVRDPITRTEWTYPTELLEKIYRHNDVVQSRLDKEADDLKR